MTAFPDRHSSLLTRRGEYEAYVGPTKAPYYVPRFEAFDHGAPAASWSWPGALVTLYWMLYRGMFLWGFLGYPLLALAASLALNLTWGVATGMDLRTLYTQPSSSPYHWVLSVAYGVVAIVATGLYSNRLYHRHILQDIHRSHRLGLSEPQRRDWLVRRGATSSGAIILAVALTIVVTIGILAAIAVPAYADYTIRAKVAAGIRRAALVEERYAAFVASHGQPPAGMADLGLPETGPGYGPDVGSVRLGASHEIRVTYAGDERIAGRTLVLVPGERQGRMVWTCHVTTLMPRYAPGSCRG